MPIRKHRGIQQELAKGILRIMQDINPKLLKIVALAKQGIGGEKDTALALVRQMCERENLDFDEVMSDHNAPKERIADIKVRSKDELRICIQVAARFAATQEHQGVQGRYFSFDHSVRLWYTATMSRHIDTLNAVEVYLRAYRKEKKLIAEALKTAFTAHHNLYPTYDTDGDDEEPRERTLEERQATWRAAQVMQGLTESVNIVKTIEAGDKK